MKTSEALFAVDVIVTVSPTSVARLMMMITMMMMIYTRVFHEKMLLVRKKWLNPLCKYLGVALKESKNPEYMQSW